MNKMSFKDGFNLSEKLEKDSQRKMESVKNFNAVLQRELNGTMNDLVRHRKMLQRNHNEEKRQLKEEITKIQSCKTDPKKSFDIPTSLQRLNFHRENILDHRNRHAHYNRKVCELARANVPKPWRATLPPKDSLFPKHEKDEYEERQDCPNWYRDLVVSANGRRGGAGEGGAPVEEGWGNVYEFHGDGLVRNGYVGNVEHQMGRRSAAGSVGVINGHV